MFINSCGFKGVVLMTLPVVGRKGIFYSLVYTWPWARVGEPPYLIVNHTKNWKRAASVMSRDSLRELKNLMPPMANAFPIANEREVYDGALTISGMWLRNILFDSLPAYLADGMYWIIVPNDPNRAMDAWHRADAIHLGDVLAVHITDGIAPLENAQRHLTKGASRTYLVRIIDGACVPEDV